ncbi:MAG: hypothetical protein SCH70_11975 [Candidatus Methanoperedens sp.]|nr:hypothetical protein [Candidatus Methanoperedens sp.]
MKRNKGMQLKALFMAFLVLSLFVVTPSMACAPIEQMSSEEEIKITNEILAYKTTKEGEKIFRKIDFEVDWSRSVLVKQGDGYMLTALAGGSTSISDVNGVSLLYDGSKVTNVFVIASREIANGFGLTVRSLINKNEGADAIIVKDNTGKAKLYVQDLSTNEITSLDITCYDICENVVSIGCSVGAVLLCAMACGPGAPVCAVVCSVLYGLICLHSQGTDCDYLCTLT